MKRSGRSFFLVFLLPLLVVMLTSMLVNLGALFYLKQEHAIELTHQKQDLSLLKEVQQISAEMSLLQSQVLEVLKKAEAGELNEGRLYRIHAMVVDRLAVLAERTQQFTSSLEHMTDLRTDTAALRSSFEAYRNHVVMATDIAAIDPSAAGKFIGLARDRYLEFTPLASQLSSELGTHAVQTAESSAKTFQTTFLSILLVVTTGLLIILLLSLAASRALARRTERLTSALEDLAHSQSAPPPLPEIEQMRAEEKGVFLEVAESVLSFREALIGRHQADVALLEHKQQLEVQIQNRTADLTLAKEDAEATSRYARSLIEASLGPLVAIGLDGCITDVNLAMEQITGLARSELIGKPFSSCFADPDSAREGCQTAFSEGSVKDLAVRIKQASGLEVEALCNASVYLDAVDNVLGVVATVHDVSGLKRIEQQLRIAAVTFESQEGIVITNAEGDILSVNQAFVEITGYTAEEVLGKNPRLLSAGRHDQAFYADMWYSISHKGSWAGEVWNRRKSGEIFPEHLTITAVPDSNGIIQNYVGTFIDITISKAANEEIRMLAFYDPLTHLPNRRLLLDRLQIALISSRRSKQHGALLFIDMDHFKILNDTMGHDYGDLMLQEVARRLSSAVRDEDTVARLGGDEFVVMLEDLSLHAWEAAAQVEQVGEKILAALGNSYQLKEYQHRSTPSIGVTLFGSEHDSVEDILKRADTAMYQSKSAGRNMLKFYDPDMQAVINARLQIENDLLQAIEHQQFQLHYQIQVDSTGQMVGAEALIRWNHPERGLISPDAFIRVLEETGMIVPVGLWVLDTACEQIRSWQHNAVTQDLVLAINISAKQFQQNEFVSQVRDAIIRHEINPALLKLELTESMLLKNIEETISKMLKLKQIGIQFSLDDFGTGFSSLQYIKRLPLDQIKIDRSFVHDLHTDANDQAIVQAIIAMAKSLGMGVIAEGVEINEQQQKLSQYGCTQYQGFLYGKALPNHELDSLLEITADRCAT